jgi:2-keto-4-pentenoate hydratase/2-oxohepta-3-ene-1,7-dioic acid hydratase in catechol pathway
VLFLKGTDTMIGPNDDVLVPRGSEKTDWEVELGVVIGRRARYLASPDEAVSTCSATPSRTTSPSAPSSSSGRSVGQGQVLRDLQPLRTLAGDGGRGPRPAGAGLRLSVNGKLWQDGNTADMAFGVDHVVWYVSQFMVLEPGDVINTGTPAGVALGQPDPKPFLRAGDVVELEIDGLGRQRQVLGQA